MKHFPLTMCVAAAALFTMPSTGFAQDKPAGVAPAWPQAAGQFGANFNLGERLKQMAETLGLTQEQQDQIKAILERNASTIKELMAKGFQNFTEDDMIQMRELIRSQFEDVSAVLTPEQKEKIKAGMQRRRGDGRPTGPRNHATAQ